MLTSELLNFQNELYKILSKSAEEAIKNASSTDTIMLTSNVELEEVEFEE